MKKIYKGIDERDGDRIVKGRALFDPGPMPPDLYMFVLQEFIRVGSKERIDSAYGVKFKTPAVQSLDFIFQSYGLQPCEIVNNDTEEFVGRNDILQINIEAAVYVWWYSHPEMDLKNIGPDYLKISPGNAAIIPHQLYQFGVKSGNQEIKLLRNFGNFKGRGETKQMRPDPKPIRGIQ